MVVIEVRHRQGGEADEEEKEKEEKEEKEEKRKAADIKSNNPHLAGGEKKKTWKTVQTVEKSSPRCSVHAFWRGHVLVPFIIFDVLCACMHNSASNIISKEVGQNLLQCCVLRGTLMLHMKISVCAFCASVANFHFPGYSQEEWEHS